MGTQGRVYGGNPNLVHVPDGMRSKLGKRAAHDVDTSIRMVAASKMVEQQKSFKAAWQQPLCPGCYMVVGFNMMLTLAQRNGQSITEMARTMKNAFARLEECQSPECIEEILVLLDPEEPPPCEEGKVCIL